MEDLNAEAESTKLSAAAEKEIAEVIEEVAKLPSIVVEPLPSPIKIENKSSKRKVTSESVLSVGFVIRASCLSFLTAVISISYFLNGWMAVVTSPAYSVKDIPNLDGQLAVVTGGNTGIGKVTALELAKKGAHVVITSRDIKKGEDAVADIRMQIPANSSGKVFLEQLDLSSLKDVKSFCENVLRKYSQSSLNILILNAGVMMTPYLKSVDGIELQFATNHLGHFLLVKKLMAWIKKSSTRVVTVSSSAHHFPYPEGKS
jgi:NADPH:quinone reductase-like Zn-dependent oxidoreductase